MKKICIFLLVINLLQNSIAQEIGLPIIRNYSPKEYNNAPQVLSAIQSNSGIMYFGVGDGLLEYDGVYWRYVSNNKRATPYDLAMAGDGKIYISASAEVGRITFDEKGNSVYESLSHLITEKDFKLGTVYSVECSSKYVYFQSNEAVIQYSPSLEKIHVFKADAGGIFSAGFIYNDVYYIQLYKEGLLKIDNKRMVPANQSEFFKDKRHFKATIPFNSSTVLIPTDNEGVFGYQPNMDTVPFELKINNENFFGDNSIFSASEFDNNSFVLGSLKKGAILVNKQGNVLQEYHENHMLQNNFVRGITTDINQNIWFGLSTGISKTEHSQDLSYWDKHVGLKDIVESVIRYNGTLYIATHQKVYYIDKFNEIQEVQNIPTGVNWCFLEIKSTNSLLVGTTYGIFEIKGNNAIQLTEGNRATEMYQSIKNPNRVYSTSGDAFITLKYENGKWAFETQWKAIKDNIRGIIEDENGDIWLGTFRNGVIRLLANSEDELKPKLVRYYDKKDGFISLKNILPFKFKNKIVWGTETGLFIFNSEKNNFQPFTELGEQFSNGSRDVFSLIEMPDGKIWICPLESEKADVGYLQPDSSGNYKWVFAPFRRIPKMFLVSFYIEPTGVAWIGGSDGLYRYDLNRDTKNYEQKFNCFIRKLTVGTDSLIYAGNKPNSPNFKNSIKLDYKLNALLIDFAAPFFDQEDKTLYSYKLEGYEKNWSKWTRQTHKEYTNLFEGKYTFQVKAKNVYDVESEIDSFEISIDAPWFRTWLAYIFYLIIAALFVFAIIKIYTRRLVKQKDYLELVVKERTFEVLQQNEEILTQRDELAKQNEHLENANEEISQQSEQLVLYSKELEKLSIVASKTDSSIIIMDAAGDFIWLNEGYERLFGYTLEELPSERKNIYTASSNPNIKTIINDCIENKKSIIYNSCNPSKAGVEIWVQTTITPTYDEDGNVSKIIAIDSDITKLKDAEKRIKEQNSVLQSSIRYAKTIQSAILPNSKLIASFFDHFIYYLPKDIVSGDFYWFNTVEIDNKEHIYVAVADCTGHGVPGAFMSMIGSRLLSEIINERKIYSPNDVLTALNYLIRFSLKQNESENTDGMDISLCLIERSENTAKMTFSGAKSKIFIYSSRTNEITRINGDRIMIGGNAFKNEDTAFTNQEFNLQKGDIIYLPTDGVIDQNNLQRKRFGTIQFTAVLNAVAKLPMQDQKSVMEKEIEVWMHETRQRDDITVMAIKI